MFERMARERTLDDVRLPFEVHGSMRNDTLREFSKNRCSQSHDNEAHVIRLRDGDLVCFRNDASQLAISSIWRKSAGTVWEWFAQIDPNLLPMNSAREQVTLAEQLFGFVQADKLEQKDGRIKALAGRVRFSAGRMCNAAIARGAYEPEGTTPILSSPKPPSPTLYFHNRGQAVKKSNLPARAGGTIRPLGRKWYLHHHRQHLRWTSVAPGTNSHQKARIRPLKAGLEFIFDIDFTNLSQIELAFLVYALRPSGDFHHRLGSGKPLGLGTVRIDPLGIFFVDRQQRYTPDDFLTANRYHRAAICDKAQKVELELRLAADDVRRRYARELTAWSLPSGEGATWQSLYDQALQLLSDQHLKLAGAKAAIEALGNPATVGDTPVHYPRLPDELLPRPSGQPDHESELFRWHQWNEERPSLQSLKPLTSDDPNPRPLQKIGPFAFFVYSGLNAQQRKEVYEILASAYPGRLYPEKPDRLASTPDAYRAEILSVQEQGLIGVHIGCAGELPSWVERVKNHAPVKAIDGRGTPVNIRTVLKKYVPFLSGTDGTRTKR